MRFFRSSLAAAMLAALAGMAGPAIDSAFAQGAGRGPSGLPLPRFVSLKAEKVNLRIGPGIDYAIAWRYLRSGVPMEIIQEYGNWRRVRDAEGAEGWINQALLSGERSAVAAPWMRDSQAAEPVYVEMFNEAEGKGGLVAKLEPGVIVTISACTGDWCKATADGTEGWLSQTELWGAYPGEAFR